MRVTTFISLLLCLTITGYAQPLVLSSSFGDSHDTWQDSLVAFTNLGLPFPGDAIQGDVVVVDEYPHLPIAVSDTTYSKDWPLLEGIRLFPNPVSDALILYRQQPIEDCTIAIINADGQQLERISWPKGIETYQYSCQGLAPGTYFIIIRSSKSLRQRAFKMVKK